MTPKTECLLAFDLSSRAFLVRIWLVSTGHPMFYTTTCFPFIFSEIAPITRSAANPPRLLAATFILLSARPGLS
ncbi:MAG: hypothetical protein ACK4N4_08455 [Burkholderiales bacterium]